LNIQEDYLRCRHITRQQSKIFSAAAASLPQAQRQAVYAVFSFACIAGELSETELAGFCRGDTPPRFIWRALRDAVGQFEIDICHHLRPLCQARQSPVDFATLDQLLAYCDDIAGTTAEMLWAIVSPYLGQLLAPLKKALARAVYLTHILLNIGSDLEQERIFLPRQLMESHGYSREQLAAQTVNQEFIDTWEDLAALAEDYYAAARPLAKHLHPRAKFPLLAASVLHRELLYETRRAGYQVFTRRAFLPLLTRFRVLTQVPMT